MSCLILSSLTLITVLSIYDIQMGLDLIYFNINFELLLLSCAKISIIKTKYKELLITFYSFVVDGVVQPLAPSSSSQGSS